MKMTRECGNEEVLFNAGEVLAVDGRDIQWLKDCARSNPRRRFRLCAHRTVKDPVHEMLIIHDQGTYVRPHKHIGRSESFHVIEGDLRVVLFEENGQVREVIPLAQYGVGSPFYYRLSDDIYHTVVPISEQVVFHETTSGPFNREATQFAPWAPPEEDVVGHRSYLLELGRVLARFEGGR